MATFHHTAGGERHVFDSLAQVLACASPRRSGDELAGIAAASDVRRVAARMALADLPLTTFLNETVIPYDADNVTRLILDTHDLDRFAPVASMTVGSLREHLLAHETDTAALTVLARGITPEMAAAVSKIMRNQDLIVVAAKCHVETAFRSTLGLPGRISSRLQPNHPTDDLVGIAGAALDGLLYGVGDAVIGVNPATDNVNACVELLTMLDDLRQRFDIPTQSCVLAHITTTLAAISAGAPVDLVFQSIAGTQGANESFGVTLDVLAEGKAAAQALGRNPCSTNVMYFETGQGSALSAGAHHGVDQQTLEARAYGVARAFDPLLVNSVVGFIGPEYLYDSKQIIRAGLEDVFCGKLLGLPMGCDVCYTNHAEADQDDLDTLMVLLATAGANFLIGVPLADDIMLSYQSLSFHDITTLRRLTGLRPAPEFETWLRQMSLMDSEGQLLSPSAVASQRLLQTG